MWSSVLRHMGFAALFLGAGLSQAAVSLPNGVYSDSVTDLQVKVQGGPIRISRDYVDGHWELNNRWNSLKFEYDDLDGSVKVIDRSGGKYEKIGDTWTLDTRYVIRQSAVSVLPAAPDGLPVAGKPGAGGQLLGSVPGYRWQNRTGDWVEYDKEGRISSYGDRNDNRVWFQYDSSKQLRYLLDHQGRVAMVYRWQSGQVSQICDNPGLIAGNLDAARCVGYSWNGTTNTTPAWPLLVKATDANGNATTYSYENGLIKTITDAENRVRTFSYLGERVVKLVEPDGATTQYSYDYDKVKREFYIAITHPQTAAGKALEERWYDSEGRQIKRSVNSQVRSSYVFYTSDRSEKITDEAGSVITLKRDEYANPVKAIYDDQSTVSAVYSPAHGQIVEETDELGVKTTYDYDSKGNLLRKTEAVGLAEQVVTEYTTDASGNVLTATRKGGQVSNGVSVSDVRVTYTRDEMGNARTVRDEEGYVTLLEYDLLGNVTKLTEPEGGIWYYRYDPLGRLVQIEDPLGFKVAYGYDNRGNLISTTDARGKESKMVYDAHNRRTKLIDPYGAVFETTYDELGRKTSVKDAAGKSSALEYDGFGRLQKAVDGKGHVYALDYSKVGIANGILRPAALSYPTFERRTAYTARGQIERVTEMDGSEGAVTSYAYDKANRRKSTTTADGKTTSYEYDGLGRRITVRDPSGNTVSMVYDQHDNLIQVTDANGKQTRFAYDKRGLLLQETDPLGKITRYAYNGNGWLTAVTRADGAQILQSHDKAGRITERKTLKASGETERTIAFAYDEDDNLTAWRDGSNSGAMSYDDSGRLLGETVRYGSASLAHSYTYYPNNQVKTHTGPDGVAVAYDYDGLGQLEGIEIPGEGRISVTEWKWAAPSRIVLPGGTEQIREYNGYLGLTKLKVKSPGQETLFELESRYGKLKDVSAQTVAGQSKSFVYNDAHRLTGIDGAVSESYTLDANGNRIGQTSMPGAWKYDDANQLLEQGSQIRYEYDDNGNRTKKIDNSKSEPNRTTVYRYDAEGQLSTVEDGAGTVIARYSYDPFGRRLVKETVQGKTLYLHGEEGLLAEADATGAVQTSYGWHPAHPYGTFPLFAKQASGYLYYHNDHMGTPWRATDKSGKVIWQADYDAFGAATVSGTLTSNLRYPGQYFDAETGLHYNDQRYYDPATGRYLTRDPLGLEGSLNLYGYGDHDPLNRLDPNGRFVFLLPMLTCMAQNYLRCLAMCSLIDLGTDYLMCGDIDPLGTLKECAVDCLWDMLPMPNPCGKFGKWFSMAMGAAQGLGALFNSFPGDVPVHTREGLRPISELKVGDEVMAWAEWDSGQTDAKPWRYEKVTDIISSEHTQKLVHLTLENGNQLTATAGHPFKTTEGWRDALLLKRGGKLLLKGEGDAETSIGIREVSTEEKIIRVYNLEVSNAHTFLVGADGVVVHNAKGVYWFPEGNGVYVGKAADFYDRLGKHRRRGRINGKPCKIEMPGSDENDRRIMEGFMYNAAKAFGFDLTNKAKPPRPKY